MENKRPEVRGRGSQLNPPNRFGGPLHVLDLEQVEHDEEYLESLRHRPTEYLPDRSRSIVTENDSPDVGFRYSLNPYRGCSHGCSYCYARPTHEFLGYNAGLDFETKILVKEDAQELFREFLSRNPREFIRQHHDVGSVWQKVRLKNLDEVIAPYKDGLGFELIAGALGVPRSTKKRAVEE